MLKLLDETKLKNSFAKIKHEMDTLTYKVHYFEQVNENLRRYLHSVESRLKPIESNNVSEVIAEIRQKLKGFETGILNSLESVKQDLTLLQQNHQNNGQQNINPLIDRLATVEEKLENLEQKHEKFSKLNQNDSRQELAMLSKQYAQLYDQIIPLKEKMEQLDNVDTNAMLEMFHSLNHKVGSLKNEISAVKTQEIVVQKFDTNRRDKVKDQILDVIKQQELTIPQLKAVLVDQNNICSKASFYRYIKSLMDEELIQQVKKGDKKLIVLK